MAKTKMIGYINIFLAIIVGLLVVLNLGSRVKNKEYSKMMWSAKIISSVENSSSNKQNLIKIIDAKLFDNHNAETVDIDLISQNNTNGILNNNVNELDFKIYYKTLLPDSLRLKYFSVTERKFYQLNTKLPSEKMKSLVKSKEPPMLILEVANNGKVALKLLQDYDSNTKPQLLESYTAKEDKGNLDMLVYEISAGEKYNNYEEITNITDFSDLLQNKYKWQVKAITEENEVITKFDAYSFSKESIETSEITDVATYRNIPRVFYVKWGSPQEYGIQYYFEPAEILSAFRKLTENNPSEPITLTFKLYRTQFPQCEISKNGIIIPLKNLVPDTPTKYAR